jgi:hypothetical protein
VFLDLSGVANASFADQQADDQRGGWTDQGPDRDLSVLPFGDQTFCGVPMRILNPAAHGGRAGVVLRGQDRPYFPDRSGLIPVQRKLRRLFFLVAAAWPERAGAEPLATLRLRCTPVNADTRPVDLPLLAGHNVGPWDQPVADLPAALLAWTATHPRSKTPVGLYLIEWPNPEPAAALADLEFISAGTAVPILVAVTGEGIKSEE